MSTKKYWAAGTFLFGVFMLLAIAVAVIMYEVEIHLVQRMPQ